MKKNRLPLSCRVQGFLCKLGIAVHNPFRNECTKDFGCCTKTGHYWLRIPQRGIERSKRHREYAEAYSKMVSEAMKASQSPMLVEADIVADIVRGAILNALGGMKYPRKIRLPK